jgi:hypothetical protein
MNTLEERVEQLAGRVGEWAEHLRLACQHLRSDPGSSLTKSRIVAEKLLLEVYRKEMGCDPKKPLLGDMLADNQFTRKVERRILSRMNAVRDMGNLGPHGEHVEPSDAARVLEDVCIVIEWYIDRVIPASAAAASEPAPEPGPLDPAVSPAWRRQGQSGEKDKFVQASASFRVRGCNIQVSVALGLLLAASSLPFFTVTFRRVPAKQRAAESGTELVGSWKKVNGAVATGPEYRLVFDAEKDSRAGRLFVAVRSRAKGLGTGVLPPPTDTSESRFPQSEWRSVCGDYRWEGTELHVHIDKADQRTDTVELLAKIGWLKPGPGATPGADIIIKLGVLPSDRNRLLVLLLPSGRLVTFERE